MVAKIEKTEAEWREQLSEQEFEVCRLKGTEPAFTGEYFDCKEPGVYGCKCCGSELFRSDAKFDSGTGWPSFVEPTESDAVTVVDDTSHGMHRTEVMCASCGAHLGHVFPDGPAPSGMRYCINSVSIDLTSKE
jgi:peptide-methionine (R)-S-oxide reductase